MLERKTEVFLYMVVLTHVVVAPLTKVEESFNVQAIHDLLFHRLDISKYDHHQFPGVVPRTFVGALAISAPLLPLTVYVEWQDFPKYWMLFGARFALCTAIFIPFCMFARRIEAKFGILSGEFLRVIMATQFHFIFYSSRPLPNTFALFGVLWAYQKILDGRWLCALQIATVFTLLFRCELALFYVCIFIHPVLMRRIPLFGWNGAIVRCVLTAFLTLGISVPIDSFLWRRWVWPEGEVLWFNVILNRSHEYGVSPFFWYFYSAIPRALLATVAFVPFGPVVDRRLMPLLAPVVVYIFMYSFLPHKELRFIIYTFPILNVSAAVLCARLWINRWKSSLRFFLAFFVVLHLLLNVLGTTVILYASSKNYPGGGALSYLQKIRSFDRNKPVSVYIDNYAAQTGVSRFLELFDAWEYNKTENMEPSQLARFNYLMIGSYTDTDILKSVAQNFSSTHRILFPALAFHKLHLERLPQFPYFRPEVGLINRLVVLEKKDNSTQI